MECSCRVVERNNHLSFYILGFPVNPGNHLPWKIACHGKTAKGENYFGFECYHLTLKVAAARVNFFGERISVTGGPTFDYVRNENLTA